LTWFWRILLYFGGEYLKGQIVTRAKKRGVIAYLHALQGTRRVLAFVVAAVFIFQAVVLAGFGVLVTGMMLMELNPRTMLWVLFGVFTAMFLVPVLAIIFTLNERVWYKFSGAEKMVEDLRMSPPVEGSEAA
jgi:hypothetical protein